MFTDFFLRRSPNRKHYRASLALLVFFPALASAQETVVGTAPLSPDMETTVRCIAELEGRRDPKCYATASRLEDFVAGTPLTDKARSAKISLQKSLLNRIWIAADDAANAAGRDYISSDDLTPVFATVLPHRQSESGDWTLDTPGGDQLTISARDKRQYSTVAYGLRAILALQQERLLGATDDRLPLDEKATAALKDFLDLYSLAALRVADAETRTTDQRSIDETVLTRAWKSIGPREDPTENDVASFSPRLKPGKTPATYELASRVVAQKMAAYETYNEISLPVFLRNIQVYFARHRWPIDREQSDQLKAVFTEAMISYSTEFMNGTEQLALQRNQALVRVDDVHDFADSFIPHRINEFEDATFFPRFPAADRITIEAYDMDAFRDSGLHWQYLRAAIEEPAFRGVLEPDPFALELLAENIAQFGVLLLRVAGQVAAEEGIERLGDHHVQIGMTRLQEMVSRHATLPEPAEVETTIASASPDRSTSDTGAYFTDATQDFKLDYTHRSSDWLNRLIRTYTVRDQNVAVLAVPPAFGGSGIAAEDINGDSLPDLLLLGGAGARLLVNTGKATFGDVTNQAGIGWRREDGLPGEMRQPIIADFDNDGLQDILITYVDDDHRLYRNKGGVRFEDVTDSAGLGGKGLVGGPAVTLDFDNDGLLDLYITYFGQYIEGILPTLARKNVNGLPNQLFRNVGNLRFEDVTEGSGVAGSGWTQAAAHTDINLDGLQDLIEGNDFGTNAYYLNQGDGTFKNVADELSTGKPSYTMSIGIADLNKDLHPDFYISNIVTMDKDQKYVDPSDETRMKFDARTMAEMQVVEANDLFVSSAVSGGLRYAQTDAIARGRASTGWAWGADFFDFDNDGDDDLYVANGMNDFAVYSSENPYYQDPSGDNRDVRFAKSTSEDNVFFLNEGGRLLYRAKESGADLHGNSRAVTYVDLDRDGDQDMVLNNYHEPATIFRNNSERLGNNWLQITLEGNPELRTNRDAIGARLIVRTSDGNTTWREIHGGGAYLTMHPKEQHIGLGEHSKADLTVRWPNGQEEQFPGLQSNKRYTLVQSSGERIARSLEE